jgi:TRAP-type mannitol/chloroaromatic compound transport system permease small subunit
MSEPSQGLVKAVNAIDRFTDRIGSTIAWLNVPLALIVTYEVVMRYVFDAPTIWVFDVTYMLYGTIFMLGAAYALHKGAHIRTDFFYEKWSAKTKGMVDSISYLVFFFPSLIMLLFASGNESWYSFTIHETSEQTPWRPILWPYKSVVPLTCIFLMVQGISETLKSLYAWRTGVVLEQKEKIEI